MNWKFWQKNPSTQPGGAPKAAKLPKPKELPQRVGQHLVVEKEMDPDWVWSLKCVLMPDGSAKESFHIRVYSESSARSKGVHVRDYHSLDDHADLIVYAGSFNRATGFVKLDGLMKAAS